MNLPAFAIRRPVFVSGIVLFIIMIGSISISRLGVDLFPEVNFPIISVSVPYIGVSPEEIETLVSKIIEEEVSSISGLEQLTSINQEGLGIVMAKFSMDTDIKDAEQQIREKLAKVRRLLPTGIEEPLIQRLSPSDVPIVRLSLAAEMNPAALYDLAKEKIKPKLERLKNIGAVKIVGGTRREIQVELDRRLLNNFQISASAIAGQLSKYGTNVPVGKFDSKERETTFKTKGRFETFNQIENAVISFGGDAGSGVTLRQLAKVRDSVEDAKTKAFLYQRNEESSKGESRPALYLDVYKQSGANTVAVADSVLESIEKLNASLKEIPGKPQVSLVRDTSQWIRLNIEEAKGHILLSILLTVIVVYFFLGNLRSTIITGIALPNSILGAFILMYAMGFTINIMTLLALTLAVGLLVDDAIVVRENIFHKIEEGMHPVKASEIGTNQVLMAVVATTITMISVFLPVGFMSGMVGQFFKQFGLTMIFAMLISLFDGLVVAPMLSAYFTGKVSHKVNFLVRGFQRFQDRLETLYVRIMTFGLRRPFVLLGIAFLVFAGSIGSLRWVKGTFMPPQDQGEFVIGFETPPGTSLEATAKYAKEMENALSSVPEIALIATVVGTDTGESNLGSLGVRLVPANKRSISTFGAKDIVRAKLAPFAKYKVSVNDYGLVGGAGSSTFQKNFVVNLVGDNSAMVEEYARKVVLKIQAMKELTEVESSAKQGKPEFHIELKTEKMQYLAVAPSTAGAELRLQITGGVVGKLYQNGLEYDIRMRLRPEQRNLKSAYAETRIPNDNFRYVRLAEISQGFDREGPAKIVREDRTRIVQITGNLGAGYGLAEAMNRVKTILEKEDPMPPGVAYKFIGQAEEFGKMVTAILFAFLVALITIYLVLAALYESFITPITIFAAIPPAISGAFIALAVSQNMLDMFAMIGMIMLLGIVTKNSILLVDFALRAVKEGKPYTEAIIEAGQRRLRPILMTSFAMIAGTLPLALGIGQAAKMKMGMGMAIIGGLFVSTFLTLVVVPVIFTFLDRLREKIEKQFRPDYDMRNVGHHTTDNMPLKSNHSKSGVSHAKKG